MTNLKGRSRSVFAFYNDRGECENRIEEFKNGFDAGRLSCHRFRANAFRLLLHGFAYNLVNLFRLQLPLSLRSAQIESLRTHLFKSGARIRQTARCVRIHLASGWPFQSLFQTVVLAFNSSYLVRPQLFQLVFGRSARRSCLECDCCIGFETGSYPKGWPVGVNRQDRPVISKQADKRIFSRFRIRI